MDDAMVTGRMSPEKKNRGNEILAKAGLNASQAINLLYTRLIEEKSADFLVGSRELTDADWASAAVFVDALPRPRRTRFDAMGKADVKKDRLAAKGLV